MYGMTSSKKALRYLFSSFLDFYFCVLHSTLLHLPPLRLLYVGELWDRTLDFVDLIHTRLDLISPFLRIQIQE
jgi:hypothetical protein